MKSSSQFLCSSLLGLSMAPAASAVAADEQLLDGEALYRAKSCVICHGEAGKNPTLPYYPKLAGQAQNYLIAQTKAIQSGERKNGFIKVMLPFMGVTDEEIQAISEYLSWQ